MHGNLVESTFVGIFRRRQPTIVGPDMITALSKAFAEALQSTFSAQAHSIEQNTKFLEMIQGMTARQAARMMGQRSGEVRRERRAARPRPPACALCAQPARRDVTLEMVRIHREHASEYQLPLIVNGGGDSNVS